MAPQSKKPSSINWVALILSLSVPIIFSILFSVVGSLMNRLNTLEEAQTQLRVDVTELSADAKWRTKTIEELKEQLKILSRYHSEK